LATQPRRGGSPLAIFGVQLAYLAILAALALIYFSRRQWIPFPDKLGPIPIGVVWFGALGGSIISISGLVDHRHDWDEGIKFWHWTRPLIGAFLAVVAVLGF
jgi:hypothetical protein